MKIYSRWKLMRKDKIVLTTGCFDLFHTGHLSLLKYCKSLGQYLIVGINSDDYVRATKGKNRPIIGENGAEIITDNTQLTIFGGFAPNSKSAEILSKAMGNRTVMSGSISKSKNDPSQSLQMIERPLMTPDELKSMPKGQFIVMKTGSNPKISKLKLFFKWGIKFNDTYKLTKREKEKIKYSNKNELKQEILNRYPRTDRLIKTVNNSDTPYSYTQKTRKAPRFDNY